MKLFPNDFVHAYEAGVACATQDNSCSCTLDGVGSEANLYAESNVLEIAWDWTGNTYERFEDTPKDFQASWIRCTDLPQDVQTKLKEQLSKLEDAS